MTIRFILFILGSIFFFQHCQFEERYAYEAVKSEIDPYLHDDIFNAFAYTDTMVIYDTSYFNKMITVLNTYQDKLEIEDSIYNKKIIAQLDLVKTKRVQEQQPDIYLSFDELIKNFETEKDINKIMIWLRDFPKQTEAAKPQLKQPDILHTQLSIEILKTAFVFITNDVYKYLEATNQLKEYEAILENAKFAIKDYLAFLNSKLINKEVK